MNPQQTCGCMTGTNKDGCHVVRMLDIESGWTDEGEGPAAGKAVALDVKTVGESPDTGSIIRLSIRQFEFDHAGAIIWVGDQYEWFEDPRRPIPRDVAVATGIDDVMVAGQAIEDWVVAEMMHEASVIISHGANSTRAWVEARLEGARGLRWSCSMDDVDWEARGFEGHLLRYLLMQAGYHHDRHRPGSAVDAVVQILQHRDRNGRTALSEMLARRTEPS